MLKGGSNTASVAPRGIHVSTSVYGKTVKQIYGLTQVIPDLIWYNDWKIASSPINSQLWTVVGGQQQGKKSGKSGKKGNGPQYYSAAIDLLLGSPVLGVMSVWYNNQKFNVKACSASGFVSGSSFSFTPVAGESLVTITDTVPASPAYVISVPNFVSDGQSTQNNTGVYDNTLGRWLVASDPLFPPGPNEYTVDGSGNYTFNAAQAGHSVNIHYRELGSGTAGVLAAIFAVTINETIPTVTFNDYGAPGSVTWAGHWDRPLWNRAFRVPGIVDSSGFSARDPYSWSWDGVNATVNFPTSAFNGYPVTVYYGVPIIDKSDGTFYSSNITPLSLLNMEFEAECGSGSEYVNHLDQQDINPWCSGVGSVNFDLGTANAIPNLQMEVIGAFCFWPNGDANVADVITDIVMSGPLSDTVLVAHGANCNDYDNGGPIIPNWPPGNGLLLGDIESAGSPPTNSIVPIALADLNSWCIANGISISLNQDTQRTAKDLLDELATIGNSAPVYSGDTLKLIPYDEVSSVGFGAVYTAPTSSGPVADLTDQDFVFENNDPPVTITRKRRTDCDNVVSLEFTDRSIDYMQNVVTEHDAMSVALYGPRKGGTLDSASLGIGNPSGSKSLKCISSSDVAQKTATILAQRSAAGVDVFDFTVKSEKYWLEAMDLVTVTDSRLGLNQVPVRLTSVKETSKRTYQCEGEKFVYGLNHPNVKGVTSASGSLVTGSGDPGLVNTPIIFQPTCEMSGNKPQVTFVVSGVDPNYGGCIVYASIDGGTSYQPIGKCSPAITGVLTADFNTTSPASDPDTTSTLAVNVAESGGSLSTHTQQTADASLDPCFVAIESGSPLDITDYEIVCPTTATLTSAYHYNLTTYIRRHCEGSTYANHQSGWRFAVLDGNALTVELDPYWVDKTVLFKFAAYNKVGGQTNQLADCTVYSYTPHAGCGQPTYVQNPPFALSQVDDGHIAMQAVSETLTDGTVISYQARASVAIPTGSPIVPQWLYVTITDPAQVGDATGSPLPINIDTTDDKVGVSGYTYIGAIKVIPSLPGIVLITAGGWPNPSGYQVAP